jgi:hypothetical protein
MDKQLKDKAIQFKGKNYVLVSDRVNYFNNTYPNGSIQTVLVSDPTSRLVIFKAIVTPDIKENRIFTGYSQASFDDSTSFVNKTSALENAETSAVGRALALMGIGVIDSIASIDEIHKSDRENGVKTSNTTEPVREPIETEFNTCSVCGIAVKKPYTKCYKCSQIKKV